MIQTQKKSNNDSSDKPILSIVTVVLNGEKYLEECIKSIISQENDKLEYIIVDGGSHDGTLDIIKQYGDFLDYWVSEKDDGIYHAMNKGVKLANGKYVWLVNSDDYLENGIIDKILKFIVEHEYELLHGNLAYVSENRTRIRIVRPAEYYIMALFKTPFKHPTCIISQNLYKRIGLYDTTLKTASDYDFMLRAIKGSVKSKYLQHTFTNLRRVGATSGNDEVTNPLELIECLTRYTGSRALSFALVYIRIIFKYFRLSLNRKYNNVTIL